MSVPLQEVLKALPAARRKRIAARVAQHVRAYRSLQEVRERCNVTQATLARRLKISQPSVSKIEGQADMLVSTMREYIAKIGGRLDLVVSVPGARPVKLEGIGELTKRGRAQRRAA
jgi:DNA-binding XRE family transcriptional regulator